MADREFPCDWCGGGGIDMQQGSDVPCWFCRGTGRTSVPRSTSAPHDTETLAEVLAAHAGCYRESRAGDSLTFTCGTVVPLDAPSPEAEHLARIVQARAGEGALREALTFLDGLVRGYEAHASIPTILRSRVLQDLTDLRAALTTADPS